MAKKKLTGTEAKEWKHIRAKSRRHGIPVKRVGPANVRFDDKVYAQLGTGRATLIMNARIRLKQKYGRKRKTK